MKFTAKLLRKIVYEEEGTLYWRERNVSWFKDGHFSAETNCKKWNTKNAGRPIGSPKGDGYVVVSILGRKYRRGRLVWLYHHGSWPYGFIDHIDGNRSNDKLANLRDVTRQENQMNLGKNAKNTSGFTGVYWHVKTGRWVAQVQHKGKTKRLGAFKRKEDARDAAEKERERLGFKNRGRR